MVKLLIKRQISELMWSLFYDTKKKKARAPGADIGFTILIAVLIIALVGGMVGIVARDLCGVLLGAGLDWLYFVILGSMSLLAGVLGGVFAAYTSLYKARDNDLLLSLPIPEHSIITARILTVYILTGLFSGLAILPALGIYWWQKKAGSGMIIGGLIFALCLSLLALALCALLGYGVALLAGKMKNKSLITVLLSLAGAGLYLAGYYKFNSMLESLLTDPAAFAGLEKLPGLKAFGLAGTGAGLPLLGLGLLTLLLLAMVLFVLVRSFRRLISASASVARVRYREKTIRSRSVQKALLIKELARFTTSPAYMLNCAMGSLFLLFLSGSILLKGGGLLSALEQEAEISISAGMLGALACAVLCGLAGSNDISAPSISLEGKNLWLLQSLPVEGWQVLKAKLGLHLLVTLPPLWLGALACALVIRPSVPELVFLFLLPTLAVLLYAAFGLMIGLLRPNLSWTNEIVPIKQSFSVFVAMMVSMAYGVLMGVLYLRLAKVLAPTVYLGIASLVTALLAGLILFWLKKRGSARLGELP